MNEQEILNKIKETHPINEGEITTWFSPSTLAETFNIPLGMAGRIAMEYNSECLLNQLKLTYPMVEGQKTTWIRPETLVETFNISMEMAQKVADRYNAEVASMPHKTR